MYIQVTNEVDYYPKQILYIILLENNVDAIPINNDLCNCSRYVSFIYAKETSNLMFS